MALKQFATDGSHDLQTYFTTEYLAMNSSRMNFGIVNLKPHARLEAFQQLVDSGILSIDVAAVDACIMFQRRVEWFLSTEKPHQLSDGDEDFAEKLINHIVGRVVAWHEAHPNSTHTCEGLFLSWAISSAVIPKCLEEIRWAVQFRELESASSAT